MNLEGGEKSTAYGIILGRLVSSTRTDIEDNKRISMFEYAFDLNDNLTKLAVLTANGTSTTNHTYGKDNQPDTVTFSIEMNYVELRRRMLKRE